jgi:NADH oxidase (H2O2-forming)
MRTNIDGIYAIGDVVETVSLITHRPTMMQLAGTAYRQGIVAGTVAAGGYTHYYGSTNTWISVIKDLQVAATGLNRKSAEEYGFKVISGFARGLSKPSWFPGGKELIVNVLADAEDGRILGAQAIGKEAAVEKIEVVAMALKCGLTIHDLANAEMAYCPAVSEVTEPLTEAAQSAVKKLKKKK